MVWSLVNVKMNTLILDVADTFTFTKKVHVNVGQEKEACTSTYSTQCSNNIRNGQCIQVENRDSGQRSFFP